MRTFTQHSKEEAALLETWPIPRPKPVIYFIEPSSLCNAACIFCHYPQMRDKGKRTEVAENEVMDAAFRLMKEDAQVRGLDNIGVSLTPTTGDLLINKSWASYAQDAITLPFVGWLDVVTNGILLNEKNIESLCKITPLEKLDFSVSVGGLDRETYKFMFGTDMFVKVHKNILMLFDYLIDNNVKLNVTLRFRVPDAGKVKDEDIIQIFNPRKYPWASYEVLDTYKDVPVDVPGKNHLKIVDHHEARAFNPCGMLKVGAMNFGATGDITACGCHYSQMPGEKSLLLGNVNEITLDALTKQRRRTLNDWRLFNKIPKACQSCQHYHQHDGAKPNKILLKAPYDFSVKSLVKKVLKREKA